MKSSKHVVKFETAIKRFADQGEKTGWTYIEIPAACAQQIHPDNKKSFRVKGKLDDFVFEKISLLPFGDGDFIMALNASIRKGIRKAEGEKVSVQMELDQRQPEPSLEFIASMKDEPAAFTAFKKLPKSHQHYFINWIESAKTVQTKATRIAHAVNALAAGLGFGEMVRKIKKERDDLLPGL
jgi:hypothetical protein